MPLKEVHDWTDDETVLIARGKASPIGQDPLDPFEAALAIADKIEELARECPRDHYLKRVKARRELRHKGRGWYVECVFAARK
jgi:hypothetical protein